MLDLTRRTRILVTLTSTAAIALGAAAYADAGQSHSGQSHSGPSRPAATAPGAATGAAATVAAVTNTGRQQPAVPAHGAYLGAWVNPNPNDDKPTRHEIKIGQAQGGQQEIAQLPGFTRLTGTHPQILHLYTYFDAPLPTKTLAAITSYGAIPMVDWYCGNVEQIAAGQDDALITRYADGLRAFGKPVFLRWYWEMNLNDSGHTKCGGSTDPAAFIAAWRHIWTIFHAQGADNVSFVWSPSGMASPTPASAFYPGNRYVDWIGVDYYDDHGTQTTGTAAVSNLFGAFYREFVGDGKPMMIAETGARAADQAGFLQGLQQALPSTYPDFKAVMYFDSPGKKGPWNLQGSGVTAFHTLADDPYFRAAPAS